MAGAVSFLFVVLATLLALEPARGKRVDSSDVADQLERLVEATANPTSVFDGLWRQDGVVVTVKDNEFTSADGIHLKADIKGSTVTITYPSGEVYKGELTPDGQRLMWGDGDTWERYTDDGKGPRLGEPAADEPAADEPAIARKDYYDSPYVKYDKDMTDDPSAYWKNINPNMQRGGPGQQLIPELVPPAGLIYEFKNKEKSHAAQLLVQGIDTNAYEWEFSEIERTDDKKEFDIDKKFAKLKGKWTSNSFGHKSVHVYSMSGKEMFKLRMSKNTLNPFRLRWSFRVMPPDSKDNDDALFTINKDYWGRGLLWMKEEWRVFRGRERDGEMIYYGVGGYLGYDFKFYKSEQAYKNGEGVVLAKIEQKINVGAVLDINYLPDKYKIKVYPGQDSALLLATATIIDIMRDSGGGQGLSVGGVGDVVGLIG